MALSVTVSSVSSIKLNYNRLEQVLSHGIYMSRSGHALPDFLKYIIVLLLLLLLLFFFFFWGGDEMGIVGVNTFIVRDVENGNRFLLDSNNRSMGYGSRSTELFDLLISGSKINVH